MSSKQPRSDSSLGLDAFKRAGQTEGLPLDELNESLAHTLEKGGDPYTPAAESAELSELGGLPHDSEEGAQLSPRTILEAILFVGSADNTPITSDAVAGLMRGVRPAEVDDLVRELNDEYAASGRPYGIESVGAGYRMTLRDEYNGIREKLRGRVRQGRLSAAAIETLSLVAYNQPITAETVTKLRGFASDALLSQLVRRGLLRIERSEEGRAKREYFTTDRFLELFGIDSIADLPRTTSPEAPAP